MGKRTIALIFVVAVAVLFLNAERYPLNAEEVEITTYYPAPQGTYKNLWAENYFGYPETHVTGLPADIYYAVAPNARTTGEGWPTESDVTVDGSFLKQLYIGEGFEPGIPTNSNAWPLDSRVSLFVKNPSSADWNCGIYSYTTGDNSFGIMGRIGRDGNLGLGSVAVYGASDGPGEAPSPTSIGYSCGVYGVTYPPTGNEWGVGVFGAAATPDSIGVYAENPGGRALIAMGNVGIGTENPDAKLTVVDGAILATGTTGTTPVSGAGTRLMWIPEHSAFRAGAVDGTQWNNTEIGNFSVAMGRDTIATGPCAIAMGDDATASASDNTHPFAFAAGDNVSATGYGAIAMGVDSSAVSTNNDCGAFAVGDTATANGHGAIAMGRSASATANHTTAIGEGVTASAIWSTAIGHESTSAEGSHSIALGNYARALLGNSVALGVSVEASGLGSMALGQFVTAQGTDSVVLGRGYNSQNYLVNNTADSIYMGVGSTIPTLFIGPSPTYNTSGNVGIGTTNTQGYKFYVNGTTGCQYGNWGGSDARLKKDIEILTDTIERLNDINGVKFNWRSDGVPNGTVPIERQIGLIAQEVEKEFPELVHTDNEGYKSVAYDKFTAVLLEAIKEQQQQIEDLNKKVVALEKKLK